MSQDLSYKDKSDLEFDEEIERILNRFELKLCLAMLFDWLGLLVTFLILDFSISQYILGFNLFSYVLACFELENIWYPYRAILGTFALIGLIIFGYICASIAAAITYRVRPDTFLLSVIKAYVNKVEQAKFKKH